MKHHTIHCLVYMDKSRLSQLKGSPSQPSQLYRASVWQKGCSVWQLTAGRLSSEFTHTLILLWALNNRLHHSRPSALRAGLRFWLHFLYQLQRSRMLCESTFGQLTRVSEPKCIPTRQKVFPDRRVTLPSKMSDPARRVALLVPAEPSLFFLHLNCSRSFPKKCKKSWLAQGILRRRVALPPGICRGLSLRCWKF